MANRYGQRYEPDDQEGRRSRQEDGERRSWREESGADRGYYAGQREWDRERDDRQGIREPLEDFSQRRVQSAGGRERRGGQQGQGGSREYRQGGQPSGAGFQVDEFGQPIQPEHRGWQDSEREWFTGRQGRSGRDYDRSYGPTTSEHGLEGFGSREGFGGRESFSERQSGYRGGGLGSGWREGQPGSGSFGQPPPGRFTGLGPKGYRRSDERITEDVSEQLTQHPEIDASEIEVKVEGGEVTITGTIDSRQTKRMVEDVVESVSGVKDLHNQLRVKQREHGLGNGAGETSSAGSGGGESPGKGQPRR